VIKALDIYEHPEFLPGQYTPLQRGNRRSQPLPG
jgi:hypothetical protein